MDKINPQLKTLMAVMLATVTVSMMFSVPLIMSMRSASENSKVVEGLQEEVYEISGSLDSKLAVRPSEVLDEVNLINKRLDRIEELIYRSENDEL